MQAFAWNAACLPYAVVTLAMLVLGLYTGLTRGDRLVRAGLLAIIACSLPYELVMALILCCRDPQLVESLARIQVGPIALLGPAMMFTILAVNGRLEPYRWLVALAAVIATISCVLCWTTDFVIQGVQYFPWGFWFAQAGPLNDPHVSQFVIWSVVGVWLSRRGTSIEPTAKQRQQRRRIFVVVAVSVIGVSDALLAHGLGVYPFSVIPALVAITAGYVAVFKHDILRAQGFDLPVVIELGIVFVFAAAAAALFVLLGVGASLGALVVSSAAVVALAGAAQLTINVLHHIRAGDSSRSIESLRPLDEFVEAATSTRAEAELAELVTRVMNDQFGLAGAVLFADDGEGGLVSIADPPRQLAIDRRVRAWLIANPGPVTVEGLPTRRLGGLREPIEAFIIKVDAQIVLPVVDRGRLVGLIAAPPLPKGRAVRDDEAEVFVQIAAVTGNALTYLALFHEAEERVEVAKEVEVASAVQSARAAGGKRLRFSRCVVDTHYQPASQFGGDWWACYELVDGRVLVAVGDVTGHGVPAALVSFTVEGACDTAQHMLGGGLEVLTFLELLNDTVRNVGGSTYAMTCFAALFDFEAGEVTFSNAGHPFPYICRKNGSGTELRSMVSRGTSLGAPEPILSAATMEIEPDDVFVFYSDALVESRSPEGAEFGERRLQRLLRKRVREAGPDALDVILREATTHFGDRPIEDDITVVVVRGAGG